MTQRSPKSNNALHLHCRQIADALNNEGVTAQAFFKGMGKVDMPVTWEMVKAAYQFIGEKMYGKPHTSDWTADELFRAQDPLFKKLGEEWGIYVEWPHEEVRSDLLEGMKLAGEMEYPEYEEPTF